MDSRERWQALQAQLTLARTAVDAGDRAAALAAVDAALAIDPDFLAAHALRDRALQLVETPRPLVSVAGYAQFEQRARRRRVDRRVDAARAALSAGRLRDAASALDEVIELDPNLPELSELTDAFDLLRRSEPVAHRGRWVAAAAAFVLVILGASWLQEAGGLKSRTLVAVTPLAPTPEQPFVESVTPVQRDTPPDAVVATSGNDALAAVEPAADSGSTPAPTIMPGFVAPIASAAFAAPESHVESPTATVPPAPAVPTTAATVAPPAAAAPAVSSPTSLPSSLGSSLPAAPPAVVAAVVAAVRPASPAPADPSPVNSASSTAMAPPTANTVAAVDDRAQVQVALQRYRSAFEGLDARSARAVWPAVNEGALARAFNGLESQSFTFDACDVQVRGEAADATCRGSARYVAKIGGHEPRVEPRTWNFTLKKAGSAWQIESARAER